MTKEKTVSEAIHYRRSVRIFDPEKPLDTALVKKCIEQASLAPNSSNMQLWEFYHITSKDMIAKIAPFCFNQNAAKTAQQLVVFVVRKDLQHNLLIVTQGTDHPLLYTNHLIAQQAHWINGLPLNEDSAPSHSFNCTAKNRYRQADQECRVQIQSSLAC
mgnify:CR=1 FL=1